MKRILSGMTALVLLLALFLSGCSRSTGEVEDAPSQSPTQSTEAGLPKIPESLDTQNGVPLLTVYMADENDYQDMDIESYVQGVLAGEMRNDWPMEAMKAQAILARTFVLKFVGEKDSKYSGADISTDISEAQAYDESAINERVVRAVNETRGQVLSYNGELPYAWFHAHAGGKTELATAALEYEGDEPGYTQSVESPDSDKAPTTVKKWTARFSAKELGQAAAKTGVDTGDAQTVEIGEKGASGRAVTLKINDMNVSAPALRIALDSTKMKSTLLSEVKIEDGEAVFTGSGYGHGVGMSQWGAYGMADEGKSAEEIVTHYFKNVEVVSLWE